MMPKRSPRNSTPGDQARMKQLSQAIEKRKFPPPMPSVATGEALKSPRQRPPRPSGNTNMMKTSRSNSQPGGVIPQPITNRPIPPPRTPRGGEKMQNTELKKEQLQQLKQLDPEFYKSVRKLTQMSIGGGGPITDRSSIHVLQLEGMNGVEWSKFENIFAKAMDNEPKEMEDLFDLFQYEFDVGTRPRIIDKEPKQTLDALLQDDRLNSFSRECVLCFLNDWKIVKGSVFDHSLDKGASRGTRQIIKTVDVEKTKLGSISPRSSSANNIALDTTSCIIEPHIFKQSTEEAVTAVKEAMKQNLPKHLFKSLHGENNTTEMSTQTENYSYLDDPEPFHYAATNWLSIDCTSLSFTANITEPYYCSIGIYDIKQRVKLCETFHFELNEGEFLKLFKKGTSIYCSVTHCIVALGEHDKENTYIVLRIDKLISQDIEKDFSKYQKKPKRNSTLPPLDTWGDKFIRQPFVWTGISLYDEKKMKSGSINIEEFYSIRASVWNDDFICDQLSRDIDPKRGKLILGSFTFELNKLSTLPPKTLDSTLNFISEQKDTNARICKEVEWFGHREYPYCSYVNNLYVYPQTLVVKNQSHPNIRVKVELLPDDDFPNTKPLGVIYTSWGGRPFCKQGFTALCAKEKKPFFTDEIKIQVPGVLTKKHHILFTIINHPNEEVIGYAYYPIFSTTHGIIKNALRTVVIKTELEPGYLDAGIEPVKISETKKPYLCFKTCLISSIYPESNALFSLSRVLKSDGSVNYEGNPEQVLQVLQRLPPGLCTLFFPAILNCLFKLMVSGDNALAPLAVLGVISVLTNIRVTKIGNEKNAKCNSMLLSYARYLFDPVMTGPSTVHECLVKYWIEYIERPEVKNLGQGEIWILLNLILKSSILKLCESGTPTKNARLTTFPLFFAQNLEQLVLSIFCIKKEIWNMDVLTMLPLFMNDLLGIIDRGIVFEMIFGYICWLNSENQSGDLLIATVKFTFLKIITNYKFYIPLNLPTEITIPAESEISEIVQKFWTKHFFVGLIMREVRGGLLQKQREREQIISLLKNLLHSHDVDPRYEGNKKIRVVNLYFPFVITAVEFQQFIEECLGAEEVINWLLCFFYIVENCSRDLLHQWWDSCSPERNVAFFKLLELASISFKNHSLYNPICFIMVDMILDFVTHYEQRLKQPNNIELSQIFVVLQELQHNQSVGFIIALYNLLAAISQLFSESIFCHSNSSYCGSLTYQVLFHCNSEKQSVRNKAASLFYFLLMKNYEETGDVERMKLQSTISLCKLLSCEQTVKEYTSLRLALAAVKEYSGEKKTATLKEMIESAVDLISRLLGFNEQLAEKEQNPQLVAELLIKIAESYFHSPNLHMTWLEALAAHHTKGGLWTEAALVHTQLACIQVESLNREKQFPVDFYAFQRVFPDCKLDSIPRGVTFAVDEFSRCSRSSVIKHLEIAISLCTKATQHELASVLYSMLIAVYSANQMLPELTKCLEEFANVTHSLVEANKDTRLFAAYFRVAFFGKAFGEEDGRDFIYRMEAKENLMTVQLYLKNMISKTYGPAVDDIEVLGNQSFDRESLSLSDDIFYIQVAGVFPYEEEVEEEEKKTPFQLHFSAKKFLFESSVGKGDQQAKKKSIFQTNQCFPNLTNRLKIVNTEEIVLTLLESAIESIKEKMGQLKEQLNVKSHEVRINQLQRILQGSIMPMVNGGPLVICETFLKMSERDAYPPHHINDLVNTMDEFFTLCGFGLKLCNQVIEIRNLADYKQFQVQIEKHYKIMGEKLKDYLILVEIK